MIGQRLEKRIRYFVTAGRDPVFQVKDTNARKVQHGQICVVHELEVGACLCDFEGLQNVRRQKVEGLALLVGKVVRCLRRGYSKPPERIIDAHVGADYSMNAVFYEQLLMQRTVADLVIRRDGPFIEHQAPF